MIDGCVDLYRIMSHDWLTYTTTLLRDRAHITALGLFRFNLFRSFILFANCYNANLRSNCPVLSPIMFPTLFLLVARI